MSKEEVKNALLAGHRVTDGTYSISQYSPIGFRTFYHDGEDEMEWGNLDDAWGQGWDKTPNHVRIEQ
jgi:hypothetical protein